MPNFEEAFFRDQPTEAEEEAARRAQIRGIRKDEAFARLLEDPAGRMWVWDKLVKWWVFDDAFIAGSPDGTAFRQGLRAAGLELWEQLNRLAPRLYPLMREENTP